jgi:hypothetical protein
VVKVMKAQGAGRPSFFALFFRHSPRKRGIQKYKGSQEKAKDKDIFATD